MSNIQYSENFNEYTAINVIYAIFHKGIVKICVSTFNGNYYIEENHEIICVKIYNDRMIRNLEYAIIDYHINKHDTDNHNQILEILYDIIHIKRTEIINNVIGNYNNNIIKLYVNRPEQFNLLVTPNPIDPIINWIHTMTKEQLIGIKGIKEKIAENIINQRERYIRNNFNNITKIDRVGPSIRDKLINYFNNSNN